MENSNFKAQRKNLIESLISCGILKSVEVIRAMSSVPREEFVTEDMKSYAYVDSPLPILCGQTISAPHMVAIMCEKLELKKGVKVLEIGAGSGYHAAVVAEIVAPKGAESVGHVYTVEFHKELVEFAKANIQRTGYSDRVTIIHGDGSQGLPDEAPFDRIFVTAAAPSIPNPLMEQLKEGGIFLIPIGAQHLFQELVRIKKEIGGKMKKESLGGVAFVPLVGKYGWQL
jgi:protein-L-isoaspartate(D-aspartate) O-methyltransferase